MNNTDTMNKQAQIIRVPTIKAKPDRTEIDLSRMTLHDLDYLRKHDPFTYHSIPEVYKAKLSLQDIDHSKLVSSASPLTDESSSQTDNISTNDSARIVTRKTRFSTECHTDKLLDADILALGNDQLSAFLEQRDVSQDFLQDSGLCHLMELLDSKSTN